MPQELKFVKNSNKVLKNNISSCYNETMRVFYFMVLFFNAMLLQKPEGFYGKKKIYFMAQEIILPNFMQFAGDQIMIQFPKQLSRLIRYGGTYRKI